MSEILLPMFSEHREGLALGMKWPGLESWLVSWLSSSSQQAVRGPARLS